MKLRSRTILSILVSGLLASCGLIDSNIANFDLSLPEKEVVVDSTQWKLSAEASLPSVSCSGDSSEICADNIDQLCGAGDSICSGSCSPVQEECAVQVQIHLWHGFDLAQEKPELQQVEGKPLLSVSISRIAYKITENTMNVASPEMTLYVGPATATTPADPMATAIGTLAPIAAGMTVGDADVHLTANGKETLSEYMRQYSVPFNLIVGAAIDVQAGDPVPSGRLSAVILVTATAGL